jgi:hypothetical protein
VTRKGESQPAYQCASKASRTSTPKTATVKGQMTKETLRNEHRSRLERLDTKPKSHRSDR